MGADATGGEEGEAGVGEALLGELLGLRDAEARDGVVLEVAVLPEKVLHPLGLGAGVRRRHVRRLGHLLAAGDLQQETLFIVPGFQISLMPDSLLILFQGMAFLCSHIYLPWSYLAAETFRLYQLVREAEEELLCDAKLVDNVGDRGGDGYGGERSSHLGLVPLDVARREYYLMGSKNHSQKYFRKLYRYLVIYLDGCCISPWGRAGHGIPR